MSDKLLVSFWGATIHADGIFAIGAAVMVMIVLILARWP